MIVAGNWKMYKSPMEAELFYTNFVGRYRRHPDVSVWIFPAFVALQRLMEPNRLGHVVIGAQNMHEELSGAFTGEISATMLMDMGVTHVLLGHSERRHVFAEPDERIAAKVKTATEQGLWPVLCVGEPLDIRDAGTHVEYVARQLDAALKHAKADRLTVAYEPVWAIGTGRTATDAQASEMHSQVRKKLRERFGSEADRISILYGGSVKPANAAGLMSQPDVDGVLVGGASLEVDSFLAIHDAAASVC